MYRSKQTNSPSCQNHACHESKRDHRQAAQRLKMPRITYLQMAAAGEHCFAVINGVFGFTQLHYRGLEKNAQRLLVAGSLANFFMIRRRLMPACLAKPQIYGALVQSAGVTNETDQPKHSQSRLDAK